MQRSAANDSPIPKALLRSPRMVRRKPGTLGPLLLGRILTAPLLLLAAVLLASVVLEPIVLFLFPAQPARIVRLWREFDGRWGVTYYVEYQLDRSGFIGRDKVLPAEHRAFQVGQAVKAHVIHLGQLGYSAMDRSLKSYAHNRLINWFGASFALAIGWVLFYAIWFSPWQSHRLVVYGEPTFGAIVSKGIYGTPRRQLSLTLTYQFKALGILRARCIRISWQRYDSAGIRDLVVILFDPKRPSRNIIYDYSDFFAS